MQQSTIIAAGTLLALLSAVAFAACHPSVAQTDNHGSLRLLENTRKQLNQEISAGLGITMPELIIEQHEAFGVDKLSAQAGQQVHNAGAGHGR